MDIEIMLRNSGYVRARTSVDVESRWGRSKRWKEYLEFPNVRDCAPLRQFLESSGNLSYRSILNEPIGERLHFLFLSRLFVFCLFISNRFRAQRIRIVLQKR